MVSHRGIRNREKRQLMTRKRRKGKARRSLWEGWQLSGNRGHREEGKLGMGKKKNRWGEAFVKA